MLMRLIVFKGVLVFLVVGSAFGMAIWQGAKESLEPKPAAGDSSSVRVFDRYPLPLGCGCAAVAFVAAFGDLFMAGRRKGAVPTYTDEEFLAKFGGNLNGQRPAQ